MPMHDWTRIDANDYHHFHGRWIYAIADVLNGGRLPPGYYAMAEHFTPPIVPDVLTLEAPADDASHTPSRRGPEASTTAGTRAAALTAPVEFTAMERRQVARPPRRRVAIRHLRGRQLVAVIEIMSPGNKSSKQRFREFLNKAVSLLDQQIHLLVIDPFPPTPRDPRGVHAAVWKALVNRTYSPPADKPLCLASYAALGVDQYATVVKPVAVGDVLPDMPLFLTPEMHVNVPLEPTYQTAWQTFPHQLHALLEGDTAT